MDARSRPAHVGWSLFRASGFTLTHDEINQRLEARGLKPIAARMYSHYSRLVRHGFEQYVTINQFDVQQLRDPVWASVVRRRSRLHGANQPAQLVVVDELGQRVSGRITLASDTHVIVTLDSGETIAPDSEGSYGVLTIDGSVTQPVEIDLVNDTTVELSVLGRLDVAAATALFPLDVAGMTVVMDRNEAGSFAETIRSLFLLFQSFDSARLACDAALEEMGLDGFTVSAPDVLSLTKTNPATVSLTAAKPVLKIWATLTKVWKKARTAEAESNKLNAEAELLRAQAEQVKGPGSDLVSAEAELRRARAERIRAETTAITSAEAVRARVTAQLRPEVVRAMVVREVLHALPESERSKAIDVASADVDSRLDAIIQDELLASTAELFTFDLNDLSISSADVDLEEIDLRADEIVDNQTDNDAS